MRWKRQRLTPAKRRAGWRWNALSPPAPRSPRSRWSDRTHRYAISAPTFSSRAKSRRPQREDRGWDELPCEDPHPPIAEATGPPSPANSGERARFPLPDWDPCKTSSPSRLATLAPLDEEVLGGLILRCEGEARASPRPHPEVRGRSPSLEGRGRLLRNDPGLGEGGEREASRVRVLSRAAADPGGREAQADSGADAKCAVERDRAAMQLDE